MKLQTTHLHRRLALALLVAAILGAGAALAQTGGGYDLTWSTLDAGGGGVSGRSIPSMGRSSSAESSMRSVLGMAGALVEGE